MQDILSNTIKFRDEIKQIIPAYEPSNIWNTDQTGFKYEMVPSRTLTWKGERSTFGTAFSPKNKATHS